MSFLKDINPQTFGTAMNGIAAAGGAAPGYAGSPGAPSMPMSPTAKFGDAMNGVAAAGGAAPGYAAQPQGQPVNHLQFLDPAVMDAFMKKLTGGFR